MSLLDKIKGLFARTALPEETQLLLSGVADVAELRRGLDEIVTRNEVEARDIEREIEKLAKMEVAQKARVAEGSITQREKINVLREIKRLQRRMNSLEKRHRIHQDNIDLHLGLFDRITEMEAMEMKKVTQSQIEEIAVDYEEKLDQHRDIMAAARAATGLESIYEDSAERAELAALEREILKEAGIEVETTKKKPEREAVSAREDEVAEEDEVDFEDEVEDEEELADEEEAPAEAPPRPARAPLEQQLAKMEAREREEPDESALELE